MKAIPDFLDYDILDFSSQDIDYPVSNLKKHTTSTESYRTTDALLSNIDIDLGAVYQDPIVLIYRPNFTDTQYFGYPDATFTTPSFTSAVFTAEQDIEMFIYKRGIKLTGFNQRYLRIQIPVQTRLDGAAYYEIGIVGIFTTIQDFSTAGSGLGLPVEIEHVPSEIVNRFQTNRKDVISLSEIPVLEFRISGTMFNSTANRTKMANVFGHPQKSLLFMDRGDVNTWQVYLLQRIGVMSMSERVPGESGVRTYSIVYETIL